MLLLKFVTCKVGLSLVVTVFGNSSIVTYFGNVLY